MRFVETEITIAASTRTVWDILLDFPRYAEWNTFIRRLDGLPEVGEEITEHLYFSFLPFPVRGKSFIQRIDPESNFTWRGSFIHSAHPLGHGTHSFDLRSVDADSTHLVHREEYGGLLVPGAFPLIRRVAEPHFRMMDADLKRHAERSRPLT